MVLSQTPVSQPQEPTPWNAIFARLLLRWYDKHGRKDLPWQKDPSPYRVWISEVMLQQTQVSTVIPYYERFMARFPDVIRLAAASEDEVLHLWTGLGYYSRARNILRTARIVVETYRERFPDTVSELEKLPGIGRSTAGAIIALANNQRAAILDGNVKRVLARYFAIDGYPGKSAVSKQLWLIAEALLPARRARDYTQAIMDLGATICARSNPSCQACPLARDCLARQTDSISSYPGKRARKPLPVRSRYLFIIRNQQNEILLLKRPQAGLWAGLWSFPECDVPDYESNPAEFLNSWGELMQEPVHLPVQRHTFTHFHLDARPVELTVSSSGAKTRKKSQQLWFQPGNQPEIGLSNAVVRLLHLDKRSSEREKA